MVRYIPQALCLILFGFLFSCAFSDKSEFQIGENFVDSPSRIVLIDTMKLYTSTVMADSFATNTASRILIGGWNSSNTGKVSCTSYFELAAGSYSFEASNVVYDSIVFVMKYDKYYVGDTTKMMTVDIRRISQTMVLNADKYLSNKASFATDPEPMGKLSFYPSPNHGDSLEVKIDNKLGKSLFDMIINKSDTISNATIFSEFFKGIALTTENFPGVMIGINMGTQSLAPGFRVYYHEKVTAEPGYKKTYFSIPYDANSIHFNHFDRNFTGSLMAGIESNGNELGSNETSGRTILQSGTGLFTKIRIPGIQAIPGIASRIAFISARLTLLPLEASYDKMNPLPDSLAIYIADRKNVITGQLMTSSSTAVYALRVTNGEFDNVPYYSADISPFFNSLLADLSTNQQTLLIGPVSSSMVNSAKSVIFGRMNSQVKPIALSVYCYIDKN
jgi:hypothetical protein